MASNRREPDQLLVSCRVCGAVDGLRRCSSCKVAFYCSQTHQQSDWRTHKVECKLLSNSNKVTEEIEHTPPYQPVVQRTEDNRDNLSDFSSDASLPKEGTSERLILSLHAETVGATLPPRTGESLANKTKERENSQRDFRDLSENTMQINDINLSSPNQITNELRYDDLCKHIIHDMNQYGMSVIDDFLGRHKGLEILNEVHHMYAAGVFQNGQLVSKTVAESDLKTIRGDKITWVRGTESGCINIGYLINQVDNVVISANKMRNNGTLGMYKIRERTKAMVACYPGSGAHYVMHVDNPNKDGRVITAIYYLNLNWDTQRSGGVLRIIPEHGEAVADIEPKFDRIIFFWSDRRNPHEVQPAHRTRYAITVWYFDAEEREAALNRFRQYQQTGT